MRSQPLHSHRLGKPSAAGAWQEGLPTGDCGGHPNPVATWAPPFPRPLLPLLPAFLPNARTSGSHSSERPLMWPRCHPPTHCSPAPATPKAGSVTQGHLSLVPSTGSRKHALRHAQPHPAHPPGGSSHLSQCGQQDGQSPSPQSDGAVQGWGHGGTQSGVSQAVTTGPSGWAVPLQVQAPGRPTLVHDGAEIPHHHKDRGLCPP